MTSELVVDSSVVAKWVLVEADSGQAQRLITDVADKGGRLLALDIALVEVVNALWKRYHRRLMTIDELRRGLDALLACPVQARPSLPLLKPALEIAAQYDRVVYDAAFVALAQDLGLQGITADEPLYNAVHAAFPLLVLLRNW